jgi:hypothetical protein
MAPDLSCRKREAGGELAMFTRELDLAALLKS